MADNTLTMFGKTYNTVGSANTNLMLQTKGDLKIRWGNKFIDLVKNGKINAEADTVKTAESSESISADGIYLIKNGDKDEIWIKVGNTLINLNQEIAQEYISYKEKQELTGDERLMAISNIGLLFDTYADLTTSGIKNGFAYVLETKKFFSIIDGVANEYVFDNKVPDPLEIGNITIKGSTEEIIGKSKLSIDAGGLITLKLGGLESISIANDKVSYNQYISSDKGIQSHAYNSNVGYFIGINSENKAIGVFDEIIVRNGLMRIQKVTYKELIELMDNKRLMTNCEYEITDFQDIRCITYDNETNLENSNVDGVKLQNVHPIVLKAKNSAELELEGYFLENPNWVVEYDPHYYHVAKYRKHVEDGVETGEYDIVYTKGRITKMTDEFGNSANFDFKHSTFTDDKKYLFNIANPRIDELNKLIELGSTTALVQEKAATNIYADASQDVGVTITVTVNSDGDSVPKFERIRNTAIVNNTIYLSEPELVNCSLVEDTKEIKLNDYIIFNDCSTITPNGNTIKGIEGKYKITQQFDGNTLNGIVYIDEVEEEYQKFPIFINNTAEKLYLKDSDGYEVKFNITATYTGNTFGEVQNSEFKEGLTGNTFKNLKHVIIDKLITNNTFEKNLEDLHIKSLVMGGNVFKGEIKTYTEIETYVINGTLIDNTFEEDLDKVVFYSTCALDSNVFTGTIKYKESINTLFKGKIDKCKFGKIEGCTFDQDSQLYNVLFYNEDLYSYVDMSLITVDPNINIRNTLFRDNITNITFCDDVDRATFKGVVGNATILSKFGKIDSSTFEADVLNISAKSSTISYSNFVLVTKLTIVTGSIIDGCNFNGEINRCEISGNLTNCEFQKLSNDITVTGPLNNVIIQVDMTPTAAQYVEKLDDNSAYQANNPFIISQEKVPKLSVLGRKTCTIADKPYNNTTVKVFIVKTTNDDYTPVGIIAMFSGTIAQIPDGWAICDGTKGTPDLRGRFIRMVSAGENPGAQNNSDLETNGAGTRQAYLKKTIKHTHTFKTYSDNVTINATDLTASYKSAHSLGVNLSGVGVSIDEKTLVQTYYSNSTSGSNKVIDHIAIDANSTTYLGSTQNNTDLKHKHTGSLTGTNTASITGSLPGIDITGSVSVPINFTPEQDPNETGFEDAINVEPQAYALIFIMKL